LKESQRFECPWCEAKLEPEISHCPACENEIIDFDSRQDEIVESPPIGGLLMFYAATCVISIFLIMYNYLVILRYGISVYNWTTYSAFIAIYNFIDLFILIVTIVLIFKKRRFVPKVIIGFEGLNLVSLAISYFLANDLPQKALIIGATIKVVWLCLWICYFLFSKRVKQTFIIH
jgi:hypothetical protein